MLKLLNKYDALRICDKCGREKIIQRQRYNILLKKKEHLCLSCLKLGHFQSKEKHEVKSMFIPIGKKYKRKGHLPQAKWKVL